jgi:hypothetical protein
VEDLSAPSRVLCTATIEEAISWNNVFIRNFTAAMHGKDQYGNPVDADTDASGYVDMVEAFNYAAVNDHLDEIPQYDDNGDGVSHTDPIPQGGDGATGAGTYFCDTAAGGAGRIQEPLRLDKTGGEEIILDWEPSCLAGDRDYSIYQGILGDFTSHLPVQCSTGWLTEATITPAEGSYYYLVVPRNEGLREGSYGIDDDGLQRVPSTEGCLVQEITECP